MRDAKSCSMSSYLTGPWSCGTPLCPGGPRCEAVRRNAWEEDWVRRMPAVNADTDAWLAHYSLPIPAYTRTEARSVAGRPWNHPAPASTPKGGDDAAE